MGFITENSPPFWWESFPTICCIYDCKSLSWIFRAILWPRIPWNKSRPFRWNCEALGIPQRHRKQSQQQGAPYWSARTPGSCYRIAGGFWGEDLGHSQIGADSSLACLAASPIMVHGSWWKMILVFIWKVSNYCEGAQNYHWTMIMGGRV